MTRLALVILFLGLAIPNFCFARDTIAPLPQDAKSAPTTPVPIMDQDMTHPAILTEGADRILRDIEADSNMMANDDLQPQQHHRPGKQDSHRRSGLNYAQG